jgi:hypothetical protein
MNGTSPGYPFVQFGATHSGHSFTQAGSNPLAGTGGGMYRPVVAVREPRHRHALHQGREGMPEYVNLYGENLSNSNAVRVP